MKWLQNHFCSMLSGAGLVGCEAGQWTSALCSAQISDLVVGSGRSWLSATREADSCVDPAGLRRGEENVHDDAPVSSSWPDLLPELKMSTRDRVFRCHFRRRLGPKERGHWLARVNRSVTVHEALGRCTAGEASGSPCRCRALTRRIRRRSRRSAHYRSSFSRTSRPRDGNDPQADIGLDRSYFLPNCEPYASFLDFASDRSRSRSRFNGSRPLLLLFHSDISQRCARHFFGRWLPTGEYAPAGVIRQARLGRNFLRSGSCHLAP